jgi:predicted aminopeptidase
MDDRMTRENDLKYGRGFRCTLLLLLLGGSMLLSSCADLGYYVQCATGHFGVMNKCTPIPELLEDPEIPSSLKGKLQTVLAIRDFASSELGLPDNGSYRSYGDLGRPYVVWNVVAAPEVSLEPVQWCFPVAGCVSYRGYFKRENAEEFADRLRREGKEVYLYGVPAYSTLNWFDDPVLNTFLGRSESHLAGMIFHELAHQQLYVKGDSSFNEAFATTVEMEGVRRWLEHAGNSTGMTDYQDYFNRNEAVRGILAEVRSELAYLYAGSQPEADMRREKEMIVAKGKERYLELRESWGGYKGYDDLMANLNNARLSSMSTYHDLVPAFQRLLYANEGQLSDFYSAAAKLSSLPATERITRLQTSGQVVQVEPGENTITH